MKNYDKKRQITLDSEKYTIDAWDTAGYINSRGVSIERICAKNGDKSDGVILRFNHYENGESGKRIYTSQKSYDSIVDNFDPFDTLSTWTMPFLNYINK